MFSISDSNVDPARMRPRDDPGGLFRGLGQLQVGGVEQDRGPARVDYGPGEFQVGAVIQVQGQRNVRACGQFLEHPGQETRAERLGGARGYLHDGGRAFLPGCADDRSQRQPVEYVERPDGVSPSCAAWTMLFVEVLMTTFRGMRFLPR